MTPDYDDFEAEVQGRLKAQIPTLRRAEGADDLMSALQASGNVPAAITMTARVSSEGRLVINSKAQTEDVELAVVIVTENFGSKASGRSSNAAIRRQAKIALVDWKPTGAQKKVRFLSERFFARSNVRVAFELRFSTQFISDYTA